MSGASRAEETRTGGRWWLVRLLPVLWVLVAFWAKVWYLNGQLGLSDLPGWAHLYPSMLIIGIGLATLMFPGRTGAALLWVFNFFGSLVGLADLLYFRGVSDLPSVSLLVSFHQLPVIREAVKATLIPTDSLLFLDLMVALPIVILSRVSGNPPSWKARWLCLLPLMLNGLFFHHILNQTDTLHSGDITARRSNMEHARERGLPTYHAYDLYYTSLPRQHKYTASSDEEILRRLALSRASIGSQYPWFGSQRGRNLLIIKLESFSSFVIDYEVKGQPVTPFLNELCQESIWGEGEDQAADGGSSDCEFVVLNSLHPASFGPLAYHFAGNQFHALPHILAEEGYHTWKAVPWDGSFWNNRTTGHSYGFQQGFYAEDFREDPDNSIGWGLTDGALYEQLLPMIDKSDKPYLSYVATVMMHHPFEEVGSEREFLKLPREFDDTMMGRYLHLARLRDEHLRQLVNAMKENGSWEDTVLVLVGDHRTRMQRMEYERLGVPVPSHRRDRVFILIHCPGGEPVLRAPRGIGLIDVAPTLVHLFGIDPGRTVFLGKNLLAGPKRAVTRSRPTVVDQEKVLYVGSRLEVSPVLDMDSDKFIDDAKPDPDMYQQGVEELRVSDTLLMADRVREFIDTGGP